MALASNNIQNLQGSTDGNNPPINPPTDNPVVVNNFVPDQPPVGSIIYLDNKPGVIYTENGEPIPVLDEVPQGTPVAPPAASPLSNFRLTKEICIAIAGFLFVLIGIIMVATSKSSLTSCLVNCSNNIQSQLIEGNYMAYPNCIKKCSSTYHAVKGTGIAFLVIGAIALLGDGAFMYQKQQEQLMQQQNNQVMQQAQI
ncbi:7630_t:CDS:1 [Paraglomus occultum]|uniref:7630_t:CDS:1 n=1 Tax=Paraglomus occultum TaxID=144539 RepID=A0A9N9BDZ4_9GLOM|nr:7630_t:CDS:1 [Paraglomus occultum]